MSESLAAAYLSIGKPTLREHGPEPVRVGRRVLYDRKALDRWADNLGGQPLTIEEEAAETREAERRFLERRRQRLAGENLICSPAVQRAAAVGAAKAAKEILGSRGRRKS
jgi:hypothetical protein